MIFAKIDLRIKIVLHFEFFKKFSQFASANLQLSG